MRRVVVKSNNKGYNNLFGGQLFAAHKEANGIVTAKQLKDYVSKKLARTEFAMPNDGDLQEGFRNSKITNGQAKYVLYFIESHLRMKRKAFHANGLLGLKRYSVEHLMPKNWKSKWGKAPEGEDKRNKALLTLGNLAIIPHGLNKSLKDESWGKKVNGLKKDEGLAFYAPGIITLQRFLNRTQWNERCIKQRADFLWNKAVECWQL
jgi:hypothetical protein